MERTFDDHQRSRQGSASRTYGSTGFTEQSESVSKPNWRTGEGLPVELLRRYREAQQQRLFERKVVERTPKNFLWDIAKLECGHSTEVPGGATFPEFQCDECRDA